MSLYYDKVYMEGSIYTGEEAFRWAEENADRLKYKSSSTWKKVKKEQDSIALMYFLKIYGVQIDVVKFVEY